MFKTFSRGAQPLSTDAVATESVDDIVAAEGCVVFISSSCPYCAQAVAALEQSGVEHRVVECTAESREALRAMTGKTSVPSGWVMGKYIGGCNDGPEGWMGIIPMLRSGKLKELMAAGR